MQAGNGTAPAPGGAAGGRPTFDQMIFMGLNSNPGKITSWTVLDVALVALATGKILLDTGRYYEFFHHRDSKWVQLGVAAGTLAATARFSLCVAQAWQLSRHAYTEFHSIRRSISIADSCNDTIGTFLNLAASSYYCYRTYKMSGRKWWLGGTIMLFTIGTFILGLYVGIRGMMAPRITIETVMQLKVFSEKLIKIRKAWGALSMTSDGMVVVTMLFYLFRSRESVCHREKRIYHKLVVLILGTMLPPALCILVVDITANQKGSPGGDYRKVFRMLIPTLFYVSLIHFLVARATIRQMLGTSLASNGMLKPDNSTQAGESIFVATYGAGDSDAKLAEAKERDLELGDVKERDLDGREQVVPLESYRRDGSPISHSSNKVNKIVS